MRVLVLLLLVGVAAGGAPVERGYPALVKQLVSSMAARGLDAIAVPERYEPGRYIAALVFPDVQVLVVSGKVDAAAAIAGHIDAKRFRDAYMEVHRASAEGRIFIHDMGCDGLQEQVADSDIYYEGANGRTIFDGNWSAQSLSEAAYWRKQEEADDKYSRALALLLDGVRRIPIERR
jgi:hypothetical protein